MLALGLVAMAAGAVVLRVRDPVKDMPTSAGILAKDRRPVEPAGPRPRTIDTPDPDAWEAVEQAPPTDATYAGLTRNP